MRKSLTLSFMFLLSSLLHGQEYIPDKEFNDPSVAAYINGTFVKSFIGFDMRADSGIDHISKIGTPMEINGIKYKGKVVAECGKQIEFASLDDIRRRFCPAVSGTIVYMINGQFIMNDVCSYKMDMDFVDRCEVLDSSDFEAFATAPKFSIIRIFTKACRKKTRIR